MYTCTYSAHNGEVHIEYYNSEYIYIYIYIILYIKATQTTRDQWPLYCRWVAFIQRWFTAVDVTYVVDGSIMVAQDEWSLSRSAYYCNTGSTVFLTYYEIMQHNTINTLETTTQWYEVALEIVFRSMVD